MGMEGMGKRKEMNREEGTDVAAEQQRRHNGRWMGLALPGGVRSLDWIAAFRDQH